jgi:outer membrane protein assembly factor BamA
MSQVPLRLTALALAFAGTAVAGAPLGPVGARAQAPAATVEVVEIRVHGNYRTPDADVIALTGVTIGDRLTDAQIADVGRRLRDSHQFDEVEVRKRFRSLTETDRAVLLILVRERVVPADVNPLVRPFKRAASQLMFLPVLDYTDGYGFTYGARVSLIDWLGAGERISVPLTWGGDKRAALEIDRTFTRDRISRIGGGGAIFTQTNPHYEIDDHRVEGWVRGEHEIVRHLAIGGRLDWADVTFGELGDHQTTYGVEMTFDTRAEPAFPRNAVFARAGWEALDLGSEPDPIYRYELEGRGFVGLVRQTVLSVRAQYLHADRPLPPWDQPLLGGASNLRGYKAGAFAGDNLAAASIELRLPLDSPLHTGRAGFVFFYDIGSVYAAGTRLRDADVHDGAGVGVFLVAPLVHLNLDVGSDLTGHWRVNFSTGFTF